MTSDNNYYLILGLNSQTINLKHFLVSALDKFININSISSKITVKMYLAWKKVILNKVLTTLRSMTTHQTINVFNKQETMRYLTKLHNPFVIVLVDKTPKTVGVK